ncbi:MAG: M20/M25/M40 family metallo-hydrolase [Synergistaceae bacterium]|nr:M20/M25/M40 family metallo-hydrolase [Synergistaceae bacterium]
MEKNKEIELLTRLVNIKSETYNETEACEHFARVLPSFGWGSIKIDEVGNVIAQRGNGSKEIMLLGHIDTVPGGPLARIDGNVLWGRGSVDAKGPLCALTVAGGIADIPPDWRITLIAAVGEEGDYPGAVHIIPKYSPAGCIIGEPSGTSGITIGYRGFLRAKLHARDEGVHRSRSAGPITATLHAASDIMRMVEAKDKPDRPVIERPSGAIMSMLGKEEGARSALIDLDIRLPIGADIEGYISALKEISNSNNVQIDILSAMPAYLVDKNNPMARALRIAVRNEGLSPRIYAKGGSADFNLAADWHCPIAAYGPGDSKLDHTNEEHLDLESYMTSISILKNGIERFVKSCEWQVASCE